MLLFDVWSYARPINRRQSFGISEKILNFQIVTKHLTPDKIDVNYFTSINTKFPFFKFVLYVKNQSFVYVCIWLQSLHLILACKKRILLN